MNKKKIVLIDGYSIGKEAMFLLPTNTVKGVRHLVSGLLEEVQPDYLAAVFPGLENDQNRTETVLKRSEQLKELFVSLDIPVLSKENVNSLDLMASLAKRCKEEGGEVVLLTGDKRLLQIVETDVMVQIPELGEEKKERKSYKPETVKECFDLEPSQLNYVFSLEQAEGIGQKTACQLVKQYETIDNLYDHLEEVISFRVRDILACLKEQILKALEVMTPNTGCEISLDYIKSARESKIDQIVNMEFEPGQFPGEEEEEHIEKGFHIVKDRTEADTVFETFQAGKDLGLQVSGEDKTITALSLCMEAGGCFCFLSQGSLTPQYLKEKTEELIQRAGSVTVLDLKSQLPYMNLSQSKTIFDASIAAYLLDPQKSSYEYTDLADQYLKESLPSKFDLLGKYSLDLGLKEEKETAAFCICYMAYVAYGCGNILREELKLADMESLFIEIEMPLVYCLFDMEEAGIQVERERLKEYGDRLKEGIATLEEKIYEETGETFNINSPKQLGEILFGHMKIPGGRKTKTGYSTAADVLEKIAPDYPVIRLILDYRQLTKLNSTYADGLAAYIGPDERIHGTFNQMITATGRISSTEPNLQNIPIRMELGREIRKVFVPREGCVFVDADYSQIELRVLAHMSGDPRLIAAYKQAEDIHAITASEVFHVPLKEVTSLQRRNAKAVNFGIVYGISSFGLSEGLSITRKEASEYIEKYFETYPGVKTFLDKLVADAKEQGYAISMFGRRRLVPELKSSDFMQRSFGERVAMNSPIQGTAADIIKIAMIHVDQELKRQGLKSRIVLQVHDELLIETYREELETVKALLVHEMKHAVDLHVPLEVEAKVGDSWFDAK
ncbi:DNA polymerase I [Clostridium sp. E02]|uniref:DNA polymerase I n=1 Tax=Clostridium sp. E02 TaxID=2487134 RepID=UPI000F51CA7D|nr:DNA polymerase I [Clostridium sp. E02]